MLRVLGVGYAIVLCLRKLFVRDVFMSHNSPYRLDRSLEERLLPVALGWPVMHLDVRAELNPLPGLFTLDLFGLLPRLCGLRCLERGRCCLRCRGWCGHRVERGGIWHWSAGRGRRVGWRRATGRSGRRLCRCGFLLQPGAHRTPVEN